MAAFYADKNIALALVPVLRQFGHSVVSTAEERRLGAPDPHQLLYAAKRGWTLLTHNRHDFQLLHIAWLYWSNQWGVPRRHAGIAIVEQVRGQSVADLAQTVHAFVTGRNPALANSLYDWKPTTGWRRFQR